VGDEALILAIYSLLRYENIPLVNGTGFAGLLKYSSKLCTIGASESFLAAGKYNISDFSFGGGHLS
jgi:hypothetical protein